MNQFQEYTVVQSNYDICDKLEKFISNYFINQCKADIKNLSVNKKFVTNYSIVITHNLFTS